MNDALGQIFMQDYFSNTYSRIPIHFFVQRNHTDLLRYNLVLHVTHHV